MLGKPLFQGAHKEVEWTDLVDPISPSFDGLPYLDTPSPESSLLTPNQRRWVSDGVAILERIVPNDVIDAYCAVRGKIKDPNGWISEIPYMQHKEVRDLGLYLPVMEEMESIIGDKMGMHLNLTGWVSTQRNWHQDEYLNPPYIKSWYCAAWFALEDIHPDSGPFQYVAGSHRWGVMSMEKTMSFLTDTERKDSNWPKLSERFVDGACEREIERRESKITTYLPRRGDVLLWHSRLLHRGSKPRKPGMQRKAFIAHYSALSVRSDMINRSEHDNGKWYFTFNDPAQIGR